MDVAFAIDALYLPHVAVVIGSILRHHPKDHPTFWIATTENVSEEAVQQLVNFVEHRATINLIDASTTERAFGKSGKSTAQHISEAMYLRLHIPHLIPNHVHRVLYLDGDVLCTSPGLSELFSLDMEAKPVAAVRDAFTRRMIDSFELPGLAALPTIAPQDMYFNSGVLLIDTERWRNLDIRAQCFSYLANTVGNRRFPDQDALNVACHDQWLRLNKRWNNMMASRLDTSMGSHLHEAVIVHSTGPVKHWQEDFVQGARTELYREIRDEIQLSGRF